MFTEQQKQIIDGSLLGDAFIWSAYHKKNWNCKFQKSQSKYDLANNDKQSYMDWHMKMLEPFSSSVKPTSFIGVGGKTYYKYTFSTHMDEIWNEVDRRWYKLELIDRKLERTKVVPQDIKLTTLSLCVWHMDDGCNNPKDANIELNTQGFSLDEVNFLVERLETDLGIFAKPKNANRKSMKKQEQYKIYIGRKSYFDFIELIKPHVEWDCFQYKLDTSGYTKRPHRGETHSLSVLTEDKINQIFQLSDDGLLQKEIAKYAGVSKAAISMILSGKLWKHLGISRPTKKKPRITKEKLQQILLLDGRGSSQKEIAERLNINQSTVSRCLKRFHAKN